MASSAVTVHTTLAQRTVLGPGSRHTIGDEAARFGSGAVFLISTGSARRTAEEVADALGGRLQGRWDKPVVHTPVEVSEQALSTLRLTSAAVIVAIGGGSAVGLSKALSARSGLPQIVVPTTYAGSEVTPVLGETDYGRKTTRRDDALLPATVIYDPELTLSMPAALTLTSAMNALAHSVEALWAPNATVLSDAFATESAEGIVAGLPPVLADLADLPGRQRLQESAWLAGLCLAQIRMGLHHQLAHALGGTFDLPHAETHTMLLPHVLAFNLPYAPSAAARLERAMGAAPVAVTRHLATSFDGPHSLRDLGVPRERLREVAERVVAEPYPNPRPLEFDEVLELLERVWTGF